jgi:hypothetical protein
MDDGELIAERIAYYRAPAALRMVAEERDLAGAARA